MIAASKVREALAQILSTSTGIPVAKGLDIVNPPCWVVSFAAVDDYQTNFGGSLDHVKFDIEAIAARTNDQGALDWLDELLSSTGPASFKRMIQADQTVAGTAVGIVARSATPGSASTGGKDYPALRFTVEVWG